MKKEYGEFDRSVWEKIKEIPAGRVSTYGEVARALGRPRAARAVGNALNRNPYAPAAPCHRVAAAGGKIGGFASGPEIKIRLLRNEGVKTEEGVIIDFEKLFWRFKRGG